MILNIVDQLSMKDRLSFMQAYPDLEALCRDESLKIVFTSAELNMKSKDMRTVVNTRQRILELTLDFSQDFSFKKAASSADRQYQFRPVFKTIKLMRNLQEITLRRCNFSFSIWNRSGIISFLRRLLSKVPTLTLDSCVHTIRDDITGAVSRMDPCHVWYFWLHCLSGGSPDHARVITFSGTLPVLHMPKLMDFYDWTDSNLFYLREGTPIEIANMNGESLSLTDIVKVEEEGEPVGAARMRSCVADFYEHKGWPTLPGEEPGKSSEFLGTLSPFRKAMTYSDIKVSVGASGVCHVRVIEDFDMAVLKMKLGFCRK